MVNMRKQSKSRSKKLQKLKLARDKRKLLEKRKQVIDKSKRLDKKISKEHKRIKQLKRETGARKFMNLTKLVNAGKNTAKNLKRN